MSAPEAFLATQPECYLAYAPRGAGLECAIAYFVDGKDVYGWFTGFKSYAYPAAYFKLENFFSAGETIFYATEGSDVYGGLRYAYSNSPPELEPPIPIDDAICHKLDQLQDAFANEWLWYRGDAGSDAEGRAYEEDELAIQDVNLKHRRLGKLDKSAPVWTYESHGLNLDVVQYVAAHWPLDYGKDDL